jgi:hypothetical protein
MPQFVFINGEKHELLDDRRLAVVNRFPEGTEIYDPSTTPPTLIPLSTEQEDFGVTTRKLIPWGSYFAKSKEGAPVGVPQRFIIVHNIPPQVGARDLGMFFEQQYCPVMEADILRWPGGGSSSNSKCRGYVLLPNAEVTAELIKAKTVYYEPMDVYFLLEASDRHPATAPPPFPASSVFPTAPPPPHYDLLLGLGETPTSSSMSNQTAAYLGGERPHGGSGGYRAPPHYEHRRGPTGNSELLSTYYFMDRIREEDVALSLRDGVFWPSPANKKEYTQVASRGQVYICFLVVSPMMPDPYLFGYARFLGTQKTERGNEAAAIQWVKHGTQLEKSQLQKMLGVNVVAMSEGTPVKPELGQSIADIVDVSPLIARFPSRISSGPPPRPEPGVHGALPQRLDRGPPMGLMGDALMIPPVPRGLGPVPSLAQMLGSPPPVAIGPIPTPSPGAPIPDARKMPRPKRGGGPSSPAMPGAPDGFPTLPATI